MRDGQERVYSTSNESSQRGIDSTHSIMYTPGENFTEYGGQLWEVTETSWNRKHLSHFLNREPMFPEGRKREPYKGNGRFQAEPQLRRRPEGKDGLEFANCK